MKVVFARNWYKWISSILVIYLLFSFFSHKFLGVEMIMDLPTISIFPILESNYTYIYLHSFTLLSIVPLFFDRRVAFYKKLKYVIASIVPIALVFILWDIYFTEYEVWGFNHDYIIGVNLFGLPMEELLFFVTFPMASIFIYECVDYYIDKELSQKTLQAIEIILSFVSLILYYIYSVHIYSSSVFGLTLVLLLMSQGDFVLNKREKSNFWQMFIILLIPFCLVNGVLTGGFTTNPIVYYNIFEITGFRLVTIPIEDVFYNFILMYSLSTLYVFIKNKYK